MTLTVYNVKVIVISCCFWI